ncbi:hypothetical protein ACFLYA_02655 [Candidatus Dependentiae bacterium]
MRGKISFYAFVTFLLITIPLKCNAKACLDLSKEGAFVTLLQSMKPAHNFMTCRENIITEGGSYHIITNLEGSIIVDADNVIIDLNELTLTGSIKINAGHKNIVIKNGAISGDCVSEAGIELEQNTSGVRLENLRIYNFRNGILFRGAPEYPIECCKVTDCNIVGCLIAVTMFYANHCIFKDVEACCCKIIGFNLLGCKYNKFKQCKAVGIGNSDPYSLDPVAFVSGFFSLAGFDNLFYECFAEKICKGGGEFCTKATGFRFGFFGETPEKDSKIINCCVDSIKTVSLGNAFGIHLESIILPTGDIQEVTSKLVDFQSTSSNINAFDWSPQGEYLAVGGQVGINDLLILKFDGTILTEVERIFLGGGPTIINDLAWSPCGRYLAVGTWLNRGGEELFLYEFDSSIEKLIELDRKEIDNTIIAVKWSHDCRNIVLLTFGEVQNAILAYYTFDGSKLYQKQSVDIAAANNHRLLAFSPDDKFVAYATGESDSTIYIPPPIPYILHIAKFIDKGGVFQLSPPISYDSPIAPPDEPSTFLMRADWNPIACCEKYYLAICGYGPVTLEILEYDAKNNVLTSIYTGNPADIVSDVKWSPNGKYLAVVGKQTGFIRNLTEDDVSIYKFNPAAAPMNRLERYAYFTPHVGPTDPIILPFDLNNIRKLDWSSCGKYLGIAGDKGGSPERNIEIWEVGDSIVKCIVQNNKIANVCGGLCGVGIMGGGACNLIDKNVVCCSCVPFSAGVFDKNTTGFLGLAPEYSQGSGEFLKRAYVLPGALANIPGMDCCCCMCNCYPEVCDYTCVPIPPSVPPEGPCVDLTKGTPFFALLLSRNPAHTIIKDCEDTVITDGGSYHLIENIKGSITVDADNVIIYLNEFTIMGWIKVAEGRKNVVIKDGALMGNCLGAGVTLEQNTRDVRLENLRISNFNTGIFFEGTKTGPIECCKVADCTISDCLEGANIYYANHCIFKDVEACCSKFAGFGLFRCTYNKFKQCKVMGVGNNFSGIPVYGFNSSAGRDNLFYECFVEKVCKGDSGFSVKTAGFRFALEEQESKIINCCVDSVKTVGEGNAFGIYLESELLFPFLIERSDPVVFRMVGLDSIFTDSRITALDWSPQGEYLAVSGQAGVNGPELVILKFDGTILAEAERIFSGGGQPVNSNDLAWSPCGRYLAVVTSLNDVTGELIVYEFDSSLEKLIERDQKEVGYNNEGDSAIAVKWSHDCRNIVLLTGGNDDFIPRNANIEYYTFDGSHLYLKQRSVVVNTNITRLLAFSPDDKFVAYATGLGSNVRAVQPIPYRLHIAKFIDKGLVVQPPLVSIRTAITPDDNPENFLIRADWSPIAGCGKYYLALCGRGTDTTLQILEYDANNNALNSLYADRVDPPNNFIISDVKWSPNGKYLAIVGADSSDVGIYRFEPRLGILTKYAVFTTQVAIPDPFMQPYDLNNIRKLDWSPCGRYLAIAGDPGGNGDLRNIEIWEVGASVTKCIVQNNKIANVCGGLGGIGIMGGGSCNLIDKNVACCCCVPFSEGIHNKNTNGFLGRRPLYDDSGNFLKMIYALPGALANIAGMDCCCTCTCYPPVDCDLGCLPAV